MSIHTDIVIEKFLKDMETICRPSSSSSISINLNETLVQKDIAELIVYKLSNVKRYIIKVAFVGLDGTGKRLIKSSLKNENDSFCYRFIDDFKKTKEWLISV